MVALLSYRLGPLFRPLMMGSFWCERSDARSLHSLYAFRKSLTTYGCRQAIACPTFCPNDYAHNHLTPRRTTATLTKTSGDKEPNH